MPHLSPPSRGRSSGTPGASLPVGLLQCWAPHRADQAVIQLLERLAHPGCRLDPDSVNYCTLLHCDRSEESQVSLGEPVAPQVGGGGRREHASPAKDDR